MTNCTSTASRRCVVLLIMLHNIKSARGSLRRTTAGQAVPRGYVDGDGQHSTSPLQYSWCSEPCRHDQSCSKAVAGRMRTAPRMWQGVCAHCTVVEHAQVGNMHVVLAVFCRPCTGHVNIPRLLHLFNHFLLLQAPSCRHQRMHTLTGTLRCWRCTVEAGSGRLPVAKPCLCLGVGGTTGRLGPGATCSSCLFETASAAAAAALTGGSDCFAWVLLTAICLVACACAHGAVLVCCCSVLRRPGVANWAAEAAQESAEGSDLAIVSNVAVAAVFCGACVVNYSVAQLEGLAAQGARWNRDVPCDCR